MNIGKQNRFFLLFTQKTWAMSVSSDPHVAEKIKLLLSLEVFAPPETEIIFVHPLENILPAPMSQANSE